MGQAKAQAPASAENDELAKVRNVQNVIDRTSASVGQVCLIILTLNYTQYPTSLGIILRIDPVPAQCHPNSTKAVR
jgi:hypothetical protein